MSKNNFPWTIIKNKNKKNTKLKNSENIEEFESLREKFVKNELNFYIVSGLNKYEETLKNATDDDIKYQKFLAPYFANPLHISKIRYALLPQMKKALKTNKKINVKICKAPFLPNVTCGNQEQGNHFKVEYENKKITCCYRKSEDFYRVFLHIDLVYKNNEVSYVPCEHYERPKYVEEKPAEYVHDENLYPDLNNKKEINTNNLSWSERILKTKFEKVNKDQNKSETNNESKPIVLNVEKPINKKENKNEDVNNENIIEKIKESNKMELFNNENYADLKQQFNNLYDEMLDQKSKLRNLEREVNILKNARKYDTPHYDIQSLRKNIIASTDKIINKFTLTQARALQSEFRSWRS